MVTEQKKVAVLIDNLYEELEFWYPYYRMKEAGYEVYSVAAENRQYIGKNGLKVFPDKTINEVLSTNFNCLIIPGGFAPDYLRREPQIVEFVKRIYEKNNFIAAICHGPWLLSSAGLIRNKMITSFYSIKDDLVNAGAYWIDQDVVVSDRIITSRNPDDLPTFCKTIIELVEEFQPEEEEVIL